MHGDQKILNTECIGIRQSRIRKAGIRPSRIRNAWVSRIWNVMGSDNLGSRKHGDQEIKDEEGLETRQYRNPNAWDSDNVGKRMQGLYSQEYGIYVYSQE